jgi:hypothetical protein
MKAPTLPITVKKNNKEKEKEKKQQGQQQHYKKKKSGNYYHPSYQQYKFFTQEEIAKEHRGDILYSLYILKEARSGEILNFIHKQADKDTEQKYGINSVINSLGEVQDKELRLEKKEEYRKIKKVSKRTIQNLLPRLEKEGMVKKNKYDVYSLTPKGNKVNFLISRLYGDILFAYMKNLSLPSYGTKEEYVAEFIKDVGATIFYIFLDTLAPQNKDPSIPAEEINQMCFDRVIEAVPVDLMFLWFKMIFLPEKIRKDINHQQQQHLFDKEIYDKLENTFISKFSRYHKRLNESRKKWYETVLLSTQDIIKG